MMSRESALCLLCITLAGVVGPVFAESSPLSLRDAVAQNPGSREASPPTPGGIFVPKPRGADAAIGGGPSPSDAAAQNPDSIRLRNGDVITGNVVSIETGGRARLTGPQFSGEVVVNTDSIAKVTLRPFSEESDHDVVLLKNGDRIQGQLQKISDEEIAIQTAAAGTLKLDRKLAKVIYYAPKEKVLLDVDFSRGRLEPFEVVQGTWMLREGQLVSVAHDTPGHIAAPLRHSGPITFRIDYASVPANGGISLFADDRSSTSGRTGSYSVAFRGGNENIGVMRNAGGRSTQIFQHSLRAPFTEGLLTIAYDPATEKMSLWAGKEFLFEATAQKLPRQGEYLMLFGQPAGRIRRVTCIEGVVPPIDSRLPETTESDLVLFANGDTLRAASLSYDQKELLVTTGFGQIKVQADKIAAIALRSSGQAALERPKDAAIVYANGSLFTLKFEKLTEEYLAGTCAYLGDIRIKRAVISKIDFPASR